MNITLRPIPLGCYSIAFGQRLPNYFFSGLPPQTRKPVSHWPDNIPDKRCGHLNTRFNTPPPDRGGTVAQLLFSDGSIIFRRSGVSLRRYISETII